MYKYAIVVMKGGTTETQTRLNDLAAQGYRVVQVIHPTAATAPCTYHDAAFLLEKFEYAAVKYALDDANLLIDWSDYGFLNNDEIRSAMLNGFPVSEDDH
jgi:hypothetical protein